MNFVTVFKGWTADEAHLVCARLEAANFHPAVTNEHTGREMLGGLGGVIVQVPENEAAEAKEFLAGGEAAAE